MLCSLDHCRCSAPSPGVTSADRAACFAPLTAASSSPLSSTSSSSSSSSSLPLLLFAGEATRPDRYMVMHAALESGVEAAKCILLADAQQHVRDTQRMAQMTKTAATMMATTAQSEPKAKSKL